MPADAELRKQLIELLKGGNAHATFEKSVEGFPIDLIGMRPASLPHSAWELLEHIRITQKDILEFSQSSNYVELKWPEGYWPDGPAPKKPSQWQEAIKAYLEDRAAIEEMTLDSSRDLYVPFPWGEGQTLLREILLVADHTSYHLGQLLLVRRALGAWPG